MKSVATFTATIYCGLKERDSGRIYSRDDAASLCQQYVNKVGLCVTVTDSEFIYTNGRERGVIVWLINYPRFPSAPDVIRAHALRLAKLLLDGLGQYKLSVVMSGETVMLEADESPHVVIPKLLEKLREFAESDVADQARREYAQSTVNEITRNIAEEDYFDSPELTAHDEEWLRFALTDYGYGCDCEDQPGAKGELDGFSVWQFDEEIEPVDDVEDPAENAPNCWFVAAKSEHDVWCYIADHEIKLVDTDENGDGGELFRMENDPASLEVDAVVGDGGEVIREAQHIKEMWQK